MFTVALGKLASSGKKCTVDTCIDQHSKMSENNC